MSSTARTLTLVALLFGLGATATPARAEVPPNWQESGQASWYGPGFHGRRTSSGEIFDRHSLTAAHESLPLGSRVLVTRQDNGRSALVTITDRMPPNRSRVIDVSQAAAARLGLIAAGVGAVTLSAPRAQDEPIEVAEAEDDDGPAVTNPRPRGPRHTRRAARKASGRR